MKLESLDSYKKDSTHFRYFASVIVVVSICGNIIIYYLTRQESQAAYSRIWIVDRNQRPYLADIRHSFDYAERIYEYEEAVREFYENGFSCDDSNITEDRGSRNLERALNLSVGFTNGQTIEDLWFEENIIGNVLENNWQYKAFTDSVLFDLTSDPIKGYSFGRQKIEMRRQTIERNLQFSFVIYDVARRTRKNPFAAKVDEIDIFNNTVISNERR